MTPNKIIAATACVFLCLAAETACAAESADSHQFKTARQIAPKVRSEYCRERPFYEVTVLKSASGDIGGYVLRPAIRDMPIPYLDAEGEALVSFHIFASDEDKRKSASIINPLRKQFPIQEALDCTAQ